jgi:hypothetical protein
VGGFHFGFRRAAILRRHQAELGLLLAALGAQQRHLPDRSRVCYLRDRVLPLSDREWPRCSLRPRDRARRIGDGDRNRDAKKQEQKARCILDTKAKLII